MESNTNMNQIVIDRSEAESNASQGDQANPLMELADKENEELRNLIIDGK